MSNETPDLNALLSNLLSNPAMLSNLGGLLGGLKPPQPTACDGAAERPQKEDLPPFSPPKKDDGDCEASAGPSFSPPCLPKKPPCREKDPRLCLLLALRPFLSRKRQTMLDGLLRIFEVLDLLDRMNGGNYV